MNPTCRCVISPSAKVTIRTPRNVSRLNRPAVSSWSRLKRSGIRIGRYRNHARGSDASAPENHSFTPEFGDQKGSCCGQLRTCGSHARLSSNQRRRRGLIGSSATLNAQGRQLPASVHRVRWRFALSRSSMSERGLWDMHAHFSKTAPTIDMPMVVAHGVTGVREMDMCIPETWVTVRAAPIQHRCCAPHGPRVIR